MYKIKDNYSGKGRTKNKILLVLRLRCRRLDSYWGFVIETG